MRSGAMVNVSDLWPAPDFPATPLLIEYAGSDRTGWGHRRSNSIHILWRFDAGNKEWVEVARATGKGTEWLSALVPATLAQLGPRDLLKPADFAERASSRVLILLDRELELLALADRGAMLSVLYEKVTARFAECL